MARFLLAMVMLWPMFSACAAQTPASAAPQAEDAYFKMKVDLAERLFGEALANPATPAAEVARAGRGLARIHWLIDGDAPGAQSALDRARSSGADLCRTATMQVRVLRESEKPKAAVAVAAADGPACQIAAQKDELMLEQAKAALDWAAMSLGERPTALAAARAALAALSPAGRSAPEAQRLKLELSLDDRDAPSALAAWRGFFWLSAHNAPACFGVDDETVAGLFADALSATPKIEREIGLERLLVRAGFLQAAQRLDADHRLAERAAGQAAYRPIAIYFAFRSRFDAATLAFNRAWARGHGDAQGYRTDVRKIFADTAAELGGAPEAALGAAFGLHWMEGETGGVESVHIGHIVDDTPYAVLQYARRGQVRFLSLDNMASNGFQSWLWDGMAAAGGWSEAGNVIVQVRSAYVGDPLHALAGLDPAGAAQRAQTLANDEARDREVLKRDQLGYLPGLRDRLARQVDDQVAADSRGEAARTGEPFEQVFLRRFWDAHVQHSIFVHEGRHALDHVEFTGLRSLTSPELEFRAKLSEIEFARYPRMPLESIFSAELGAATAHGEADARVMRGLVAWMDAHRGQVAGFDAAVPTAEQIDKLTDQQFRDIATSMDPYFKEHPAAS